MHVEAQSMKGSEMVFHVLVSSVLLSVALPISSDRHLLPGVALEQHSRLGRDIGLTRRANETEGDG